MIRVGLALAGVLVAAACGGGHKGAAAPDLAGFECNSRKVEYMVAGGFAAPEAGIRMDCEGERPTITRWRLEESGQRTTKTFALSGEQFNSTWEKVDSTGWRFLAEQCEGSSAEPGDPVYSIDVADYAASKSMSCAGKELPFPYDRLVNELDLRAAGFGDDAGAAP